MEEALRIVLAVLVTASLATITVYVLVFVAAVVWTVVGARRLDAMEAKLTRLHDLALADDLDRVLAEILGRSAGLDT